MGGDVVVTREVVNGIFGNHGETPWLLLIANLQGKLTPLFLRASVTSTEAITARRRREGARDKVMCVKLVDEGKK